MAPVLKKEDSKRSWGKPQIMVGEIMIAGSTDGSHLQLKSKDWLIVFAFE